MRRILCLIVLSALGALSITLAALQQPAAGDAQTSKDIDVDKLRDNLYVLKGGGGNTAVFIEPTASSLSTPRIQAGASPSWIKSRA